MFINCPQCRALVATDPVTDLPPPQCPRCAASLRDPSAAPPPAPEVRAAPAFELGYLLEVPAADEGGDAPAPSPLSAQIHRLVGDAATAAPVSSGFIPIASLLRPADATAAVEGARDDVSGTGSAAPAAAAAASAAAASATEAPPGSLPASPAPTPATHATQAIPVHEPPAPGAGTPGTPPAAAAAGVALPPATAIATDAGTRDEVHSDAPAIATAAAPVPGTPPAPRAAPLPSFARRRTGLPGAGFDWKTSGVLVALALLLALQLLLADRARLAADARWRPLLANVCGVLGCALPPWREPSAFTVLARDVRPLPSTPGALQVTASFRNDARWPQPWPRLRLVLSDVDGRPVAARDFAPREYLGAAPEQAELASGQAASVAMDIAEPGPRSVAFDFELH